MSVYGAGKFSAGLYGGITPTTINSRIAATVYVYDQSDFLKGIYQTGVGFFIGCDFGFNESGCSDCSLYFSDYVAISKTDRVKIFIFDNPYPFYTGVIRYLPVKGSKKTTFVYKGAGYSDYFERISIQAKTFSSVTIGAAVKDIIDNYLYPNSPINKSYTGIDADLDGITLTNLEFKYAQVDEVLSKLKEIADSTGDEYLVGVDQSGDFFFRKRQDAVQAVLTVGKYGRYGIASYIPEDQEETVSRIYVLRSDGTLYGTFGSVENIDIREEKITAPEGMDDADIELWAQGVLKQKEQNKRQSTIEWKIAEFSPLLLTADGQLRIISNQPPTVGDITATGSAYGSGLYGSGLYGGNLYSGYDIDDTLAIKDVRYILNAGKNIRQIQLGSLPIEIDRDMVSLDKNIKSLRATLGV